MCGCFDCPHLGLTKKRKNGRTYYFGVCQIDGEIMDPKKVYGGECDHMDGRLPEGRDQ